MLHDKLDALVALRAKGARIDLACYWRSEQGHGGPIVSPSQSAALAALDLELWFDFYAG
jgi:hypothetical protein